MSMYNNLMDFVCDETVKMLAGTTNAPTLGPGGKSTSVLPFYSPEGAAGIKDVYTDLVFYRITFRDDPTNKQFDAIYTSNTNPALSTYTKKYNRTMRIDWGFCGNNAMEWADTLRIMLFDPSIRVDFATKGMSLIPEVEEAVFVPELIGQQWLHRYDLTADFNQLVIKQTTIPAIATADIIIVTDKGDVSECLV